MNTSTHTTGENKMSQINVTIEQLHHAITICQLAIQQAREAGESTGFYEMLASSYIDGHLTGQYNIVAG
jgi:hypothetical protein